MKSPIFIDKVYCVSPYGGEQNQTQVEVCVWNCRAHGSTYLKSINSGPWRKSALAYFVSVSGRGNLIGEIHLLRPHLSLETLAHECAHVGTEFSKRHLYKDIPHCPYNLENDPDECVAYVTGHLTSLLFQKFSTELKTEMLLREDLI
jgi:hypothetical protein